MTRKHIQIQACCNTQQVVSHERVLVAALPPPSIVHDHPSLHPRPNKAPSCSFTRLCAVELVLQVVEQQGWVHLRIAPVHQILCRHPHHKVCPQAIPRHPVTAAVGEDAINRAHPVAGQEVAKLTVLGDVLFSQAGVELVLGSGGGGEQ